MTYLKHQADHVNPLLQIVDLLFSGASPVSLVMLYKTPCDLAHVSIHISCPALCRLFVPETSKDISCCYDSACLSCLSFRETPAHPLKPLSGVSFLNPSLTFLTRFILFPSVCFGGVFFGGWGAPCGVARCGISVSRSRIEPWPQG